MRSKLSLGKTNNEATIMHFEYDHWYHVYNRGNNRQPIFFKRENYLFFLQKCRKQLLDHTNIIAYCLMPNHFHLLLRLKPKLSVQEMKQQQVENHPLVQKLATLLSSYTQAINKQENRIGSLFQSKTKAKNLMDGGNEYPFICFQYIHQNPLRAGIVQGFEDWEYSSYRDYAGLRNGTLSDKKLAFESFSIKDEEHFKYLSKASLNADLIKNIF